MNCGEKYKKNCGAPSGRAKNKIHLEEQHQHWDRNFSKEASRLWRDRSDRVSLCLWLRLFRVCLRQRCPREKDGVCMSRDKMKRPFLSLSCKRNPILEDGPLINKPHSFVLSTREAQVYYTCSRAVFRLLCTRTRVVYMISAPEHTGPYRDTLEIKGNIAASIKQALYEGAAGVVASAPGCFWIPAVRAASAATTPFSRRSPLPPPPGPLGVPVATGPSTSPRACRAKTTEEHKKEKCSFLHKQDTLGKQLTS